MVTRPLPVLFLLACLSACNSNNSSPGSPTDSDTASTDSTASPADTNSRPETTTSNDVEADSQTPEDTALTEDTSPPTDACQESNSDWTVGLQLCTPDAYEGYTLLAPNGVEETWLLDIHGRIVHQWPGSYGPGHAVYLLENGHLLRTGNPGAQANKTFKGGGQGGHIEERDWDGNIVWETTYSSESVLAHHDVALLPNNNILVVAWELKTEAEAIAAGRDPSLLADGELWPDHIVEIERSGNTIVWEWHLWDHVIQDFDSNRPNYGVVSEHPELLNLNFPNGEGTNGKADWVHVNSVAYNADLDQIIFSGHNTSEIYIIDHSTTSAEAASHEGGQYGRGGDFLYRWGNPQAYGAGDTADQAVFLQHDAQWIAEGLPGAGNILIFNNGQGGAQAHSSVVEIQPTQQEDGSYALEPGNAYGPSTVVWEYTASPAEDFYARNISGAQRLPNGNTLICSGPQGRLFEVTTDKEIVWEYINPATRMGIVTQGDSIPLDRKGNTTNSVFRAYRYGPDYPGLAGMELIPGEYVEGSP